MPVMKKEYKYFDIIVGIFVAALLISNIASTKIAKIWVMELDGGTILFPLTYIFNDVLTEVYGYKKSRKVIWTGFACTFVASIIFLIVGKLPSANGWNNQDAYMAILGQTPRIIIASLCAYFVGEFANSYVLAKMKIFTKGKWLWTRTIGSTVVGEFLDSIIFVIIAFAGTLPNSLILNLIVFNYIFKTSVEVIFTPITYKIIGFLKNTESEDYYDTNTNFNPFAVKN